MKIYIVDKNITKVEPIVTFLESKGFQIKCFNSIGKFQNEVKKNKPALVICNPVMEGASPFLLVKWLKENFENIPIIVYSPTPSKEIILSAKKYKINAFMVYPFKNEELYIRIRKILKLTDNFKIETSHEKSQLEIVKKEKIKNEILMSIDKLPSFPAVIREVEKLINSSNSNAKDFEEVIEKDQVITAKILKIVNSPFYSLARKFTTISESVAYIGLDSLRSIIYSASVSNLLKISIPTYGYKREQLWKHSYTTAILSKMLGKLLKFNDKLSEELFVGGLIHDIGKIVVGVIAKKENIIIVNKDDKLSDILEKEVKNFYYTHENIGGLIADKWRLPEIHKKIIMNHHNPIDKETAVVAFANNLSNELIGLENLIDNEKEKYYKQLDINEETIDKIKEEVAELVENIEKEGVF